MRFHNIAYMVSPGDIDPPADVRYTIDTSYAHGVTAYVCGHTHKYSMVFINDTWQVGVGHARGMGDTGSRSTYVLCEYLCLTE